MGRLHEMPGRPGRGIQLGDLQTAVARRLTDLGKVAFPLPTS
jgi:hypothetical protein